jgi:hypothetical protein
MPDQEAEKEVIEFGVPAPDPNREAAYQAKINKAKEGINAFKGNEPRGVVPRPSIPRLDGSRKPTELDPMGAVDKPSVRPRPPGSPAVRPETQAQIAQAVAAGQQQEKVEAEEVLKKEIEDKKEDIFDAFDFGAQNEAERILNNKVRRKEIESRCKPMSIEDLIMKDQVEQIVPIIPDKFEVTFRTCSAEESLFIKKYLASKQESVSDAYAAEKYTLCQLACALVALNGKEFPDHRDKDGIPEEKHFEIKLQTLLKKSVFVIVDLNVNYIWFDIRVRRLFNPEKLGNG